MQEKPATLRTEPPPLRLGHIFLFLAVCSLYLAFATSAQLASPPHTMRDAIDPRYRRIIAVPDATLDAATTTVFVLLVVWSFRRRRVWDQPGHWIALWVIWQMVALQCISQLVAIAKWLAQVETGDEMIQFWEWGKGIYALQFLPFGVLFLCLALGWRGVANTWPWKIYFASVAIWLLAYGTVQNLPFDWRDTVRSFLPDALERFIYQVRQVSHVLLLLAMLNDLRPGKPRRHWAHWLAACHPLLAHLFRYFPPYVWVFLHPSG